MVFESESFLGDTNWLLAPQPFSQTKLNDLVCDLELSKKAAEILVSRLQVKHLLHNSEKVLYFQKQDQFYVTFFSEQKQCIYCHDIAGLLRQLAVASYIPTEWRLFLDSLKKSLKCVTPGLLVINNVSILSKPHNHETSLSKADRSET